MNIRDQAAALWTRLLQAMRDDEMIAHCITKTGPKTTAVIVELCQKQAPVQGPWLSADMKPQPNRQVLAVDEAGDLVAVYWSESCNEWLLTQNDMATIRPIVKWCFVQLPPKEGEE